MKALQKFAKFFNGGYANDPYSTSDVDSRMSNAKDVVRNTRKRSKGISRMEERNALHSAVKGAGLGGAVGAGVGAVLGGKAGALSLGLTSALSGGTLAGVARALSNSNIREAKATKKLSDRELQQAVIGDALAKEMLTRMSENKMNRIQNRNDMRRVIREENRRAHNQRYPYS